MSHGSAAALTDVHGRRILARVSLNGYKSYSRRPTGENSGERLLWSFTIVQGKRSDVELLWTMQQPALLHTEEGKEAAVRVIALPVDEDSYGLLEFI